MLDELGCVHIAATDANDKPTVDDLGENVPFTELILAFCDSLDLNREIGFIEVLCECFIDDVTSDRLVQFYLLELEDLLPQAGVFVVQLFPLVVETLQILQ